MRGTPGRHFLWRRPGPGETFPRLFLPLFSPFFPPFPPFLSPLLLPRPSLLLSLRLSPFSSSSFSSSFPSPSPSPLLPCFVLFCFLPVFPLPFSSLFFLLFPPSLEGLENSSRCRSHSPLPLQLLQWELRREFLWDFPRDSLWEDEAAGEFQFRGHQLPADRGDG